MLKSLTAAVLAGTIAITGMTATPAQANGHRNDDLTGLIFGLAAVGIAAKLIHDNNQKKKRKAAAHAAQQQHVYRHHPQPQYSQPKRQPREIYGEVIGKPRHAQPRHDRREVPATCIRRIRTDNGRTVRLLGRPCLERNGVNTARLPNRCERTLHLEHRSVPSWSRRCLINNGYRISG